GPLLAVDAPSMLFRAFYALPDSITGPDGTPVNALLGTANLVLREVELHDPRAVVLCFGPDAADYRVELFDGYHAERPEVPVRLARRGARRRGTRVEAHRAQGAARPARRAAALPRDRDPAERGREAPARRPDRLRGRGRGGARARDEPPGGAAREGSGVTSN